jgi:hypothetical protein
MKTIVSLIFSLLLIPQNIFGLAGTWKSGAVVTNPTSATVFVSALLPASGSHASPPSANYWVGIQLYCSIQETYELQVLNASQVVQVTIPYVCSATQPNQIPPTQISFPIQDGWTLQIIPAVGFTGSGSAQIFYAIETLN